MAKGMKEKLGDERLSSHLGGGLSPTTTRERQKSQAAEQEYPVLACIFALWRAPSCLWAIQDHMPHPHRIRRVHTRPAALL